MKKTFYLYASLILVTLIVIGVSYAAFTDKGDVLGSTFSMGSADIKFLKNIAETPTSENLSDEATGPTFTGIHPFWTKDYNLKIYNNSESAVSIASNANYTTSNDPDELRQIIFVEPFDWNDANNNGLTDEEELQNSYGKKTITKWKTEGFNLGQLDGGHIKGLLLRFSTETVSDTKQGKSGSFDFEFDSIGV